MTKGWYFLLDLPVVDCRYYNKLYQLTTKLSIEEIGKLCQFAILEKVTIHNARDILRFIDNPIPVPEWGPGNFGDVTINQIEHYNKHILSEEGEYWKTICPNLTLEWYINYPISNFHKMTNVVVSSNGKYTYYSGFVDNVFIVGRYEGDKFGISPCYYVVDGEKPGRYVDRCIS